MTYRKVTLSQVLDVHERYKSCTKLATNLCDGYLYAENPLFRNVRDAVERFGATFTTDDFCHYSAFFRAALKDVLAHRKFYYNDNVTKLMELDAIRPGRFRFKEIELKPNQLFHESTHLIADVVLSQKLFESVKHKDRDQKEVLRVQLGEALASTHDSLGAIYCQNWVSREVYSFTTSFSKYEWSSAFHEPLLDVFDFKDLHRLTFLTYAYSYLLYEKVETKEMRRALSLLFPKRKFSGTEERLIRVLFEDALTIVLKARLIHANFYFRYILEKDRSINDLSNFDFVRILERNPDLLARFDDLAEIAEYGARARAVSKHSTGLAKVSPLHSRAKAA